MNNVKNKEEYNPRFLPDRKNPNYPPYFGFTVVACKKCGEWYEPICRLPHICKKQNSYPMNKENDNADN
jgi:hypothetical protein